MHEVYVGLGRLSEPSSKSLFSVRGLKVTVSRVSVDQSAQIREEMEREVEYYRTLTPDQDWSLMRDIRNSISRADNLINSGITYVRHTEITLAVGRRKLQRILPF